MGRIFKTRLTIVDRNTKKKDWYAIQHWLRCMDRQINKSIDHKKIRQGFNDLMLFGQATMEM